MSILRSAIGKSILLIVVLVLILSQTPVNTVFAGPNTPIDLYTDKNGDGIPDELLSKFENIAHTQVGSAGVNQQAAVKSFVESLPYSQQTRKLQQQARLLQIQINKTKDTKIAQSLLKKISALQKQMMTDSAYAQTMSALEKIYVRNGNMPAGFSGSSPHGQKFVSFNGMPTDAVSESRNTKASTSANSVTVNVYPGDVILIRPAKPNWVTSFFYAMWYTHTGTYVGSQFVYDSNDNGVRLNGIQWWKQSGNYVALAYNKTKRSQAANAVTWAENKYKTDGTTKYNYWLPDKWTDSKLYCSQLVWKINQHLGTDVDSNAWQYYLWLSARYGSWIIGLVAIPAVAPDELRYDSDLYFYAEGWTQ